MCVEYVLCSIGWLAAMQLTFAGLRRCENTDCPRWRTWLATHKPDAKHPLLHRDANATANLLSMGRCALATGKWLDLNPNPGKKQSVRRRQGGDAKMQRQPQ